MRPVMLWVELLSDPNESRREEWVVAEWSETSWTEGGAVGAGIGAVTRAGVGEGADEPASRGKTRDFVSRVYGVALRRSSLD